MIGCDFIYYLGLPSSPEPQLWPSMLKGNAAVCNGAFHFSWNNCDEVVLHDGRKYMWRTSDNVEIKVVMGPDIERVTLDGSHQLKCQHVDVDGLQKKTKQLLSTIPHLFTNVQSIKQSQREVALTEESGSGGEEIPDLAFSAVFDQGEWENIMDDFRTLRSYFKKAQAVKFENAAGKFFIERLIRYMCFIKKTLRKQVNIGTNSSGSEQPGCTNLGYWTGKFESERSSSSRSTPSTSSVPSTPEPVDNYFKETHSRYPDTVFWDYIKEIYRIVVEVKSGDKQPAEHQTTDQMVGLFRSNQKYMLGLIIKPNFITIRILERVGKSLDMHSFPYLALDNKANMQLVCEVITAFIFLVDC